MRKIAGFIKKYGYYLAGVIIGGIGGYMYWYHAGCTSGACFITSSPVRSTIWGSIVGCLLFYIIFSRDESSNKKARKIENGQISGGGK